MGNKIKEILKAMGAILTFYFASIVFSSYLGKYIKSDNFWISNISALASVFLVTALLFFIYRKKIIKDFKDFLKNGKKYIKFALRYWVCGVIIMLIVNLFISFIVGSEMSANESINRAIIVKMPFYALIAMCILAPINEEITFRLSIKKIFKNKYLYAILSGLIFGYIHVMGSGYPEVLYMLSYGTLGYFFALIVYESDNIFTSISLHMFHNSLAILLLYLTGGLS